MTGNVAGDADEPTSISEVLQQVEAVGLDDKIELRELVAALGEASFGPLLLLPAVIIVSPLSGIPGLPTLGGITIVLISGQMVFGRHHLWLPEWLLARKIGRARFDRALDWLQRPARFVDGITRPRIEALVEPPFSIVPEIICMLCGLMMPFLEFVPFSSTILATAVTFFAVALIVRDGLLTLIGIVVFAAAAAMVIQLFG